ncbi:polysialyltransferase family glycosyltransferase [Brevibacterium sp. Marseille-P9724]|uniref:polysialyltransferase family glycosyltransferase n=1 Tax=Brevibacterium sp. Marseille-P9724 TaxID=2614125 RepID=UPI00125EFDE3|nr:polysialyltransferase family glycosyltransferase [Brevibacterium sp. Marseille-P9724]
MKQLFFVSTMSQVITLAAGIDDGAYDTGWLPQVASLSIGEPFSTLEAMPAERRVRDDFPSVSERVLVVSNHSLAPETATPLWELPEAQPALSRFDRVVDLNATLSPIHPSTWSPEDTELPVWERLLRQRWELGDAELELIVESPQVNPAVAIGRVFHTAFQRVHADGLMSYAATRNHLHLSNGQRMTSLHYLPYIEQLDPVLLSEHGIVPVALSWDAYRRVVVESLETVRAVLDAQLGSLSGSSTALVVGQYLAALDILTPDEEDRMHVSMLEEAHRRGAAHVVFKPHPAAPPAAVSALRDAAEGLGLGFTIFNRPVIAEAILEHLSPALVIGCFSTTLATARSAYGIPAVAVGTQTVLNALTPFENSNRIPAVLCDAVMDGSAGALTSDDIERLQGLIEAIAYASRPKVVPHLRTHAESYLKTAQHTDDIRYFRRRRLTKLNLPGALPKKEKVQNGKIERRLPTNLREPYRRLRRRVKRTVRPLQR